jgi:hypothetical protein
VLGKTCYWNVETMEYASVSGNAIMVSFQTRSVDWPVFKVASAITGGIPTCINEQRLVLIVVSTMFMFEIDSQVRKGWSLYV